MTTGTNDQYISPRVNIIDHPETVLVEAELPGVTKDGVELEIKEDELVLTGRRKTADSQGTVHVGERPKHDYRRVFALSRAIDATNIGAEMKDGLLKVTLHKTDAVKPRRIKIK